MDKNQSSGKLLEVKAGTELIKENELSRKMFIIKEGKVRVYKNYMGARITLAILGKGEVFGELSFFDAEPRSASVETLVDSTLILFEGEQAENEIKKIPPWINSVFKQVFYRLREADQRMTVLESMNEFQKKMVKTDNIASTIYTELLRFIKTLDLIFEKFSEGGKEVATELLLREMDNMLGNRFIGLKTFWKVLKDYQLVDYESDHNDGTVLLQLERIKKLTDYLEQEMKSERFLLLSHSAIAILRKIIGHSATNKEGDLSVDLESMYLYTIPLHEEAIKELVDNKLFIEKDDVTYAVKKEEVAEIYTYQCILKSFDHTMVNVS